MSDKPIRECEAEALRLNKEGYSNSAIGQHIGVHRNTVRGWLKRHGVAPKMNGDVSGGKVLDNLIHTKKIQDAHLTKPEDNADKDELQEDLENHFNDTLTSAIVEERFRASKEEDVTLAEIAEAQTSPADKYQHYVAAAGIKLLRDSMKGIRAPKTIREMSELDQLIRRNLGLNAKMGGGGGGKMQIDISILNNTKADKGGGAIKKRVIDADTGDDVSD